MFRARFFQAYGFWHWGEGLQTVLFTWYMTFHAGLSAAQIGFYQALVLSPFLVFTIAGGALTDRIGARLSFIGSTTGFAVLLMAYGGIDHVFGFQPQAFFAFCVLAGCVSAVSNPAIDTFIPDATPLPPQENALQAATAHNLAKLTGTVTGLLLPMLLAFGGFLVNGLLMLLSVLALRHHRPARHVHQADRHMLNGSVTPRILQHYRSCPENFDILLSSALLGLLVVPAGYILWPLVLRERFPEYGGLIALVNISSWIGAIVATGIAKRYSIRLLRPGRVSLLVWLAYAFTLACLILVNSFAVLCLTVMVMGSVKVGKAMIYGKYIHNSPAQARGVLISVDQTAFWGLATLGSFGLGRMVEAFGLNSAILITSAAIGLGISLLTWRGRLGSMVPA